MCLTSLQKTHLFSPKSPVTSQNLPPNVPTLDFGYRHFERYSATRPYILDVSQTRIRGKRCKISVVFYSEKNYLNPLARWAIPNGKFLFHLAFRIVCTNSKPFGFHDHAGQISRLNRNGGFFRETSNGTHSSLTVILNRNFRIFSINGEQSLFIM